ncbi:MAG TPA: glutamate--tRNA ligase [Methanoregulaceae archaeon]|nr:glutamate--tRNA ligase [Methanoregulaceae archaeon]
MDELRDRLLVHALENAVKHRGTPKAGAIIGAVMGRYPELRPRAAEAKALIDSVIAEVDALDHDERTACLAALAPELLEVRETGPRDRYALPPLSDAANGVVMRFAPNPSGPLHLGHARAAALNDAYVRQYGGRYILRIEDTDPKRVDPEAYRSVPEDMAWLGCAITETVYQSDRLELYYEYARRLIERGGAYVCTCENERFRELRQAKTACPCRAREVEEDLARFEGMLAGEYAEGEASLRVRTDLEAPDPALRDFPVFRILTSTLHPRIDASVYPLMNFSVAVDDHLLGCTHVIRGKDHIANTRRQQFIYDWFGWTPPHFRHYGRMGIEGVVLSTSEMRAGIAAGRYEGWDDIRLGTLRALARRGIEPEAVKRAMLAIGVGETDIQFSWENLFAENRAIVDPVADRLWFVPDPVPVEVSGALPREARPLRHPGMPGRGTRTLAFDGIVVVPAAELGSAVSMLRLKDLFNVDVSAVEDRFLFAYAGDDLAEARAAHAPIVQWLPVGETVPCTLRRPEGDLAGVCEPAVREAVGRVVQFERVGFVRIDCVGPDGVVAYLTHR